MHKTITMLGVLLAATQLAAHCENPGPGPAPHDAGTPADCRSACDRLRALKCPEGEPTAKGSTCEAVCEHSEQSGTVTLWPACVTKIQKCAEVDSCTYGSK